MLVISDIFVIYFGCVVHPDIKPTLIGAQTDYGTASPDAHG